MRKVVEQNSNGVRNADRTFRKPSSFAYFFHFFHQTKERIYDNDIISFQATVIVYAEYSRCCKVGASIADDGLQGA